MLYYIIMEDASDFTCNKCNRVFTSPYTLKRHLMQKKLPCDEMGKNHIMILSVSVNIVIEY